jgi:hypothetical protein
MGLGAMAENLLAAAAGELVVMREQWDWQAGPGETIAVLQTRSGLGASGNAGSAIARRCANRHLYDPAPLAAHLAGRRP